MAARIVLDTPRFKGEFPLDIDGEPLTNLEWRWVKKISGYLPLTLGDGLNGGDPDLFVALAVVALVRAGKVARADAAQVAASFDDLPVDGASISLVGDEEEAEEETPTEPAVTPETVRPLRSSGGSPSDPSSASPVVDLSRTGALA